MQHKKERGVRTKGRKKNKTCFTNIFVIFFVFFFYFFGQRKNLQCRWAEASRWHWMKINELRLDEFVELPAMISPKRGREAGREMKRTVCSSLAICSLAAQHCSPGSRAATLTVANKWPHNLSWQPALAKNELSHSKRPKHLPGLGQCARRVSFYQHVCVCVSRCVCVVCVCVL